MTPPDHEEPMSFGQWLGTLLLLMAPLVGLVLLIYWAASKETPATKRNFARAQLVIAGIAIILVGVFVGTMAVPAFQKVQAKSQARAEAQSAQSTQSPAPSASPRTETTPVTGAQELNEPVRTLKSIDGRAIEAAVIGLTDDQVTIRRADGQVFTLDMARFSPDDVAYFMRLRRVQGF